MRKQKASKTVSASEPRCVVTKKIRRFEAYCCMICRTNYVTIVQALLHLKAIHRPHSKILIHDKNVFHNLDKALEVPPVPLPWHVAKKMMEPGKVDDSNGQTPTYVIPPGDLAPSTITETISASKLNSVLSAEDDRGKEDGVDGSSAASNFDSPIIGVVKAITKRLNKQIKHLQFKEDCSEADVLFMDGSTLLAIIPDFSRATLSTVDMSALDEIREEVTFTVESTTENGDKTSPEEITVRPSNPSHARALLVKSIIDANPDFESPDKICDGVGSIAKREDFGSNSSIQSGSCVAESDTESSKPRPFKAHGKKSVRFTLGAPESSDDEQSSTPVAIASSAFHEEDSAQSDKPSNPPTIKISEPIGKTKSEVEDRSLDGLQVVIDDLIHTASKGRIIAPTSPSSSSATSLPHVGSSPALFNMSMTSTPSNSASLTRVQSWSPSVAPMPFSIATMRRPYTARGFTYAEKIQFMKQQNDYDAEFVNKHIATPGKPKSTEKSSSNPTVGDGANTRKRSRESSTRVTEANTNSIKTDQSKSRDTALENAANATSVYTTLLQRGLLTAGTFPSEYYGSGEWASAAMESLKCLEPVLKAQEELSSQHLPPGDKSSSPFLQKMQEKSILRFAANNSLSDDNSPPMKPFVKATSLYPRKRSKSINELSSASDEPRALPKRKKHKHRHVPQPRASVYLDTSPSSSSSGSVSQDSASRLTAPKDAERRLSRESRASMPNVKQHAVDGTPKVQILPLVRDGELGQVYPPHIDPVKTETPQRTASSIEATIQLPVISRLSSKSMGAKCSSDSALSSSGSSVRHPPITSNHTDERAPPSDQVNPTNRSTTQRIPSKGDSVLRADEQLVLMKDVSLLDFQKQHVISTRLKNDKTSTNENVKMLSNMSEMFQNCIETYVQVKYVKKTRACKVCGFSVDVTNDGAKKSDVRKAESTLEAHVMEHSLKELYATNYESTKR